MATVASSNPGVDTITARKATHISDLVAGENLGACEACYIDSDGTVKKSLGAAANAAGAVLGIVSRAALAGEVVTLHGVGTRFQWTDAGSLTPGAPYYVAAAGGIDNATQLGDTTGCFVAADVNDLVLIKLQSVGG